MQKTLNYTALMLITLGYLLIASLFAIRVPDWQTPDEPAHYNYIAQIAETGRIPVIEMGDWDQNYLDELRSQQFDAALLGDLGAIEYEDHQPPLYYLLATPVYSITDGSLTALRLFSVLIGLIIVWCAYAIGRLMFPERPVIGLGAAACVAFQPQHIHILASVNNDALGWASVGLTLTATVAYLKQIPVFGRDVPPWLLGILVGIGLMTKSTTYFMAGVVGIALLLRWYDSEERNTRQLIRSIATYLVPALILGGLWWGRNIIVYGWPDFLGLAAHDEVVVGQPRTADRIEALGFGAYVRELIQVTFNSFWGQFGWMGVPMQPRIYTAIQVVLLFAFTGLGLDTVLNRNRDISRVQRHTWVIMGLVALLSVLAFLYYNSEFQQYQGRYMFPLLIPLGLWLTLGLDFWRRLLTDALSTRVSLPAGFTPYLTLLPYLALALFDLWLLWRVVVPNL